MGRAEIEAFLTYLAVERSVAASTQNQALCAILYRYRHVLRLAIDTPHDWLRARRLRHLPTSLHSVLRSYGATTVAVGGVGRHEAPVVTSNQFSFSR